MLLETVSGTKVLFERNTSQIINIQILTNIGSSDEEQNQYGVAHFLEHMMFKGTQKRDAKMINHEADLLGAKLNAWTWHDQTNYHMSVMKEHFENGFELLSDLYQNATIPEEEVEKERTVILSEIRRYEDDPGIFISDLATDYFCLNGTGHKVTGYEETVKNITRQQLADFKSRYYGGENVLISIVGDIDFEKVKSVILRYFSYKPAELSPVLTLSEYRGGVFEQKKADIQECQYLLLYPAFPHSHPKAAIQGIMSFVLGGNASSFLFERIREELGLCYGIYSRTYRFEGFNYLEISTSCAEKDISTMHEEVMKLIDRLKNEPITPERLRMVKSSMLSSLFMSIESSSGLNSFLSLAYLKGEREKILQKRIDEIKSASIEGIMEIARETFSAPPLRAQLVPE